MGQAASKSQSMLDMTELIKDLPSTSSSSEELYSADDELEDEAKEKLLPFESEDEGAVVQERWWSVGLQVLFPFLIAGFGMVAAGLVLDTVQHWPVFVEISEIFILVPALLGLKGNLEMTLASRLSTAANLGKMDTRAAASALIIGNLALVQCQGIVVGLLASLTGLLLGWAPTGRLNPDHGLLLCASSVFTASLASFVLGLVMVFVILLSRRFRINPDNVATPIAASLGDLTTLALLAWVASLLWSDLEREKWLAPVILTFYFFFTPVCVLLAFRCVETRPVLATGWSPVLLAMLLSSSGGLILDYAVTAYPGIAVFQPVMNGVGGNLVAVQASRMSTDLHARAGGQGPGKLPAAEPVCVSPLYVVYRGDRHSQTACVLLALAVPGQLIFAFTISYLEAGHTAPTATFLGLYLATAWLQVAVLLYVCRVMVFWMWRRGTDPDNSAIPYLTALGDLLGGAFLGLAFVCLALMGAKEFQDGDISVTSTTGISSNLTGLTI